MRRVLIFRYQGDCWSYLRGAARKGDAYPDLSYYSRFHPSDPCRDRTPLFFATSAEQVETLLDAGLDPDIRDKDGQTALFVHVVQAMGKPSKKYQALIDKLLESGADLRIEDESGESPLHASRMWNSTAAQYWRGRLRLERILDERGVTLDEFFQMAPRMKEQLDFLFERMMIAGRIQYNLGYAMARKDPNRHPLQDVGPSGLEAAVDSILTANRKLQ